MEYNQQQHTGATHLTEVGITLSHGHETRTLFGVALRLTTTARETILTYKPRPLLASISSTEISY